MGQSGSFVKMKNSLNTLLMRVMICGLATFSVTAWPTQKAVLIKAAFAENWMRYPAPDAILQKFIDKFSVKSLGRVRAECQHLTDDTRALLGTADPLTGQAVVDAPSEPFVNWYSSCLAEYIKSEDSDFFSTNTSGPSRFDLQKFYGKKVIAECTEPNSCSWDGLSAAAKADMVQTFVHKYIGPEEVLIDLGVASSETEYVQKVVSLADQFSAHPDNTYDFLTNISSSGTAVTVRHAGLILKFIVNVGDLYRY
jgi:hypothetical protein